MATDPAAPPVRRRTIQWILIAVAAGVATYTVIGFWGVPWVLESYGARRLGEALQRPVKIDKAAFNPYAFTLRIQGLAIDEPDGQPLVRLQELFTDLALTDSLGGVPTVARLDLVGPEIHLTRLADGRINLALLGPAATDEPGANKAPGAAPKFKLTAFTLDQGRVVFRDETAGGFQTTLSPVTAALSNLTTEPGQQAACTLSLVTEAGEKLALDGRLTLAELALEGRLALSGISLAKYAPYYRGYVGFEKAGGRLDVDLAYRHDQGQTRIDPLSATLSDLALDDPRTAETLAGLARLKIDGARMDSATRQVTVDQVDIQGLAATARRDAQGRIDLAALLAPPPDGRPTSAPEAAVAAPETPAPVPPAGEGPAAPVQSPAWKISVARVTLAAGPLEFQDAAGKEPARAVLETLNATLGPIDAGSQGVRIADLGVEIRNLVVADPAGERRWVAIPRLALKDTSVDTAQGQVQAGRLEIDGTRIQARRLADGRLDLAGLFTPPASKDGPAPADAGGGPAWVVSLATLALADHGLRFEDQVPKPAAVLTLEELALQVDGLTTAADAAPRIELTGRVNQKGALSLSGTATLSPLSAELAVKLQDLAIEPFQPYFQDQVQMTVRQGQIGADGRLSLALPPDGPPRIRYRGKASVARLAAVDRRQKREFLRWKHLFVEGVDIRTEPMQIQVGRVALSDYYARVIIGPDGSLNLAEAFRGQDPAPQKAPAAKAAKSPPVPVRVDEVTLQGGQVDFSDLLTKPNFETRMVKLGGRISGLSSQASRHAAVLIQGALENQSPLEISGRINPLAQEIYTDLKLTFRNIELSPFSPYSGKYIGYTLAKGKLTLELDYRIAERKLQAQNRIFFDALTLGEPVESPDATSLPVKLALALLTDRQGRIELDVPVQGNLDDPEFSIIGLVGKALVNLLTKIVTAPFDALASLFSGQMVTRVGFEPASAELSPETRQEVARLADVLYDRPALRLEIEGTADLGSDEPSMRQARFDELLQAAKHAALLTAGQAPGPVDQIRVFPEEKALYVAQAYAVADFPKPRDEAGKEKILPPEEIEKLLYTQTQVDENDLRRLASDRAAAVRDLLLADERLMAERIFTVQPRVEKAESTEAARQVHFNLK